MSFLVATSAKVTSFQRLLRCETVFGQPALYSEAQQSTVTEAMAYSLAGNENEHAIVFHKSEP